MKYNTDNLCFGCMHPLDENGQCTHCNFEIEKYQMTPRCIRPGNRINRYAIGRVIGEGNFGITYIGRDLLLERVVAIKEYFPLNYVSRDTRQDNDNTVYVYNRELGNSYQKELENFYSEAKKLSKFYDVDGIVSVTDFFYANETAYLVMTYVEGCTLKEHIKQSGAMDGMDVLALMKPMIQALLHIHKEGIIHRDISPDNIIINKYEKPVLIDFGSARQNTFNQNQSLTVMFKRGYTPEEQYRGDGKQGTWSDVYALCATMYFMLTGIPPDEAIDRMLEDRLTSLCDMPEVALSISVKRALMHGMAVQPEERIQDMQQLLQELYGENETELSDCNRKRIMVGKIISLVLLLCLGITIFSEVFHWQKESEKSVRDRTVPEKTNTIKPQPEKLSPTASLQTKLPTVFSTGPPKITSSPKIKKYTIPNVTGMDIEGAGKKIRQRYLKVHFIYVESNKPVGVVLKQNKGAGKKVKKGTKITLTVSKGKKKAKRQETISKNTKLKKKTSVNNKTSNDDFVAKIPKHKYSEDDFVAKIP